MKIKNKKLKILLIVSGISIVVLFLVPPLFVVSQGKEMIVSKDALVRTEYGVIFGAGVDKEKVPNDVLTDRLEVGSELYFENKADFLVVSGNNNDENNNETDSMANYLIVDLNVPDEVIYQDPKGDRTYDTCARLEKFIVEDEQIILVTQRYHLYRALFTCDKLGLDVVGVSATNGNYENESFYKIREFFALYKAFIDIYILEPNWEGK